MQEAAARYALEILTAIMQQFDDGAPQVYRDAILLDGDDSLHDAVVKAVEQLSAVLNQEEPLPVIPHSQRRRVGINAYGNWVGFIGKKKIKDFGKDQSEAWKWRNETE